MPLLILGIAVLAHRLYRLRRNPFAFWPATATVSAEQSWQAAGMIASGIGGAMACVVMWAGLGLPWLQGALAEAPSEVLEIWSAFAGGMAFQLGGLAGMLLSARFSGGGWSGALAPLLPPWRGATAWRGLRHVAGSYPLLVLAYTVWTLVLKQLGIPVVEQDLVELFRVDGGLVAVSALLLMTVCVAPVVEELFFRGLLYPALRPMLGTWGAAIVSSLGFAAVHFHAAGFVPFFLLGIVLCRLSDRSGDIRACILAHAVFNLNTAAGLLWM